MDIKTTFLNAPIDEDIWVRPLPHLSHILQQLLEDPDVTRDIKLKIRDHIKRLSDGEMLKLLLTLYGTKLTGRNSCNGVPSAQVAGDHWKALRISHSSSLTSYRNIDIERDRANATIYFDQKRFIEKMNKQLSIPIDTSVVTPMQENLKLLATEGGGECYPEAVAIHQEFSLSETNGCNHLPDCLHSPPTILAFSISNPTFQACKVLVRLAQFLFNTRDLVRWFNAVIVTEVVVSTLVILDLVTK